MEKVHVEETLKSVAKLHAASIRYEAREIEAGSTIGEKYKDILFETSFHIDIPWCSTGLKVIFNFLINFDVIKYFLIPGNLSCGFRKI